MKPPRDVLIAGAGPTGLVLALWLARQGVDVRIVDKTAGARHHLARRGRARAHAGAVPPARPGRRRWSDAGTPNPGINLWVRGKRRARIPLGDAGAGLTPYPFILVFPQDRHEQLLIERLLATWASQVERETELLGSSEHGDHVRGAPARRPANESCEARYLAGCDGARSPVRHHASRASRAAPTTSCSTWPTYRGRRPP
jgi:2-polyprenyl-6-methoxyphenol hydroxylase-like FAD-dependent oxidoreductase